MTGPGARPAAAEKLRLTLSELLAAELPAAAALRRDLHRNPDLSGAEAATAAAVAAALGSPGAPAVADTGRLIRIGPPDGPCIAVRAELDGLPVPEQTGAEFASANGAMHACGHDVHLAALTALGRAACQADLPVAMLAVLQPREEAAPSGALDIATSASFAAHQPAAVIGVHLQHALPAGTVSASAGVINAATDDFEIIVTGRGGHAGYPQLAADPVLALCQSVVTLQQLISRRIDPTHAAVISVGRLQAGHAPNVIPASATASGTIRTLDQQDRLFLRTAIGETVAATCRAHGCEGVVTVTPAEPALMNDALLAAACQPLLRQAGFAVETDFRSCGADDFAYYGAASGPGAGVPSVMLFAGSGTEVALHHAEFLPADEAIGDVAAAMLAGYLAALELIPAPSRRP
ncbi:MAG TPA: M20 family metallopeptidase [Streptosporangiaceae bacterium]|nr:M20 family metallopeptidase [Streptosporangiaceae bacterium]